MAIVHWVLGVLCVAATAEAASPDVALLTNRTISALLPSDPSLMAAAVKAATTALSTLEPNGSWPDINYADVSHNGRDHWDPASHLSRLQSMATVLVACDHGDTLCNSTALATASDAALKFWLVRNPCSENWYFNQISAPNTLSSVLLLLQYGERLSAETLALADPVLRRGADFWEGWSGMNLVDLAKLQIFRGLLFSNETLIREGFDAVWGQLVVMPWPPPTPSETRAARCNSSSAASVPCIPDSCQVGGGTYLGDGIQADDSFHQHGAELEDGAYGDGLTTSILDFLPVGQGTKWACPPENLEVFARLLRGQRLMTVGRVWDWPVCGRGCVISAGPASNNLSPGQLDYAASLYTNASTAAGISAFASQLRGDPQPPAETALGAYAFPRSDYLIVRRDGWAASWKGRSNRTIPARCVNGDSKLSANTGEGATFVYRASERGSAHAAIWPVIDWEQYPGITSEQGNLQACAWNYTYDHSPSFVGAASDGTLGVAAQVLAQNAGLTARRSWLFTADGVASWVDSLGGSTAAVLTTMANQRRDGDVTLVWANGSVSTCPLGNSTFPAASIAAVAHNHTLYMLAPQPQPITGVLEIEAGVRTGDYGRISTNAKPAEADVFRLSYRHTELPNRSELAPLGYTVLPNVNDLEAGMTAGATIDFPPQQAGGHAIVNTTSGETAAVIWEGGATVALGHGHTVTANASCILSLRWTGATELTLAAANPELSGGLLSVTLSMSLALVSGLGCSVGVPGAASSAGRVAAGTTLTVTLPGGDLMGSSIVCTLRLQPKN